MSAASASRFLASRDRTLLGKAKESLWRIDHSKPVVFIGSCFSEVISSELERRKFDVVVNPQGTMFNPISISKCITNVASVDTKNVNGNSNNSNISNISSSVGGWKLPPAITSSIFQDALQPDVYHSWDHSTKFSNSSLEKLTSNISNSLVIANKKLQTASSLFLTLGTSYVHSLSDSTSSSSSYLSSSSSSSSPQSPDASEVIVSNCHKQPSRTFSKRLLSVNEVVTSLSRAIDSALELNSGLKVALTVSPVRHTREGLVENNISKAILIQSVHELCEVKRFREVLNYFPSYELVMDELRDYRWYADDLVHLSRPAEEIVYSMFEEQYLTPHAKDASRNIVQALQMYEHRPIVEMSRAHVSHLNKTLAKFDDVEKSFFREENYCYCTGDVGSKGWLFLVERQKILSKLEQLT